MASDIVAIQSFAQGETIFREGEVGRTVFLVREGLVRIARDRSSSNKQSIGRAGPGQVFGENALLSIGPRPNSAIAEKPTKCVVINRDKLTATLKTEDAFIAALYNILATNMRSMIDKPTDLDGLLQDLSDGGSDSEPSMAEKSSAKPVPKETVSSKPPTAATTATTKPAQPTPAQPKPAAPKPAPVVEDDDDDDAFLI